MLTSPCPPAQGLFDLLYGSDAFLRAYHKALNNDPGRCTGIEGCTACPTLPWLSALLPAHSGVHAPAMACRLDSSMQCWRIRRHMGQVVPNPCAPAPQTHAPAHTLTADARVGEWSGDQRTVHFSNPVDAPAFIKRLIGAVSAPGCRPSLLAERWVPVLSWLALYLAAAVFSGQTTETLQQQLLLLAAPHAALPACPAQDVMRVVETERRVFHPDGSIQLISHPVPGEKASQGGTPGRALHALALPAAGRSRRPRPGMEDVQPAVLPGCLVCWQLADNKLLVIGKLPSHRLPPPPADMPGGSKFSTQATFTFKDVPGGCQVGPPRKGKRGNGLTHSLQCAAAPHPL